MLNQREASARSVGSLIAIKTRNSEEIYCMSAGVTVYQICCACWVCSCLQTSNDKRKSQWVISCLWKELLVGDQVRVTYLNELYPSLLLLLRNLILQFFQSFPHLDSGLCFLGALREMGKQVCFSSTFILLTRFIRRKASLIYVDY